MSHPITHTSVAVPRCKHLWRAVLYSSVVLLASFALSGCETPLFPENLPRSPYERYMVLRGQDPDARSQNSHGIEQNNLRDRLKPLGSP
jgi:hypothetical protein